ncbi:hypothetical protein PROFUN_05522 [Planoprotostelium fungivorum]|uniref:Uncharacterized protein n=1 Tax=Planoprotostelium fungivorum TaxID=1890364 RepID=A0A2P6NQZ3_9EUKA|nr:hypothetical protein PROFUN_05522 [Planoprotostelium fungivorum]
MRPGPFCSLPSEGEVSCVCVSLFLSMSGVVQFSAPSYSLSEISDYIGWSWCMWLILSRISETSVVTLSHMPAPKLGDNFGGLIFEDEPHKNINNNNGSRGCLSRVVLFKLLLTLGLFAFMALRPAQTVTLDPFESLQLSFCPSWVRGVDIVAPFPASEWVRAHKFRGQPVLAEEPQLFNVGYNVTLHNDYHTRTHVRSFHFAPESTFDVSFQADSNVRFMIMHPEVRHEGRRHSPRSEGHHRPHHGDRHGRHSNNTENSEETPAPSASAPAHESHQGAMSAEFKVSASGGRYDFIFSLPKNSSDQVRINIKIAASVRTLDTSRSCPIKSSLNQGQRHIRVRKEAAHHIVLAASPYARGSSIVYVRLAPRENKFVFVSGVLLFLYVVLRLVTRFLLAHSKRKEGKGCFWARLCGKKNQAQYSPLTQIETQN